MDFGNWKEGAGKEWGKTEQTSNDVTEVRIYLYERMDSFYLDAFRDYIESYIWESNTDFLYWKKKNEENYITTTTSNIKTTKPVVWFISWHRDQVNHILFQWL